MKKKIINCLMLMVVGIMFLVFAVGSTDSTTTTTGTSSDKLELVEVTSAYNDGYSSYYIEGSIKNNTDKEYSYVQVTFNLYDADGVQVGTAMDNINHLDANGTWKFKAIGLSSGGNVASYKLTEITGW